MFDRQLFEAARDARTVESLAKAEVDLRKAGAELRGQCPLCGAGSKTPSGSSPFAVHPGKRTWKCYVCAEHGDVVDLERALRGGTPVEAARRLTGAGPLPARTNRPAPKAEAPKGPSASDRVAIEIQGGMGPLTGTLAERYLLARGIAAEVIAATKGRLFFHPRAKWGWDEDRREWITAPAMVAPIVVPGPDGRPVMTGGVHCTYLARDGRGKAALDPAKRMWGPQGLSGRMGVAWLCGDPVPEGQTRLSVGEGIETVLSILTIRFHQAGRISAGMAALSLDRLQGGLQRDSEGRIDVADPQPDPERPAITWPGPWLAVIGVDRDMGKIKVKGLTPRGKPCEYLLDAEARARLCGRLARKAWAATANQVRVIVPPPGCDFNDDLRRRLAAPGGPAA